MLFKDLAQLLRSVEGHILKHGGVVLSDDNPMKRLIGFSVGDERWEITLTDVVRSRLLLSDDIQELFPTAEGRQEIARRLTEGTVFDA